jgi:hypothetical protein
MSEAIGELAVIWLVVMGLCSGNWAYYNLSPTEMKREAGFLGYTDGSDGRTDRPHRPDLFYRGEYDTWFAKGESMRAEFAALQEAA